MTLSKRSYALTIGLLIIANVQSAQANHHISINDTAIDLSKPIPEALLAEYNRDGIVFDYDNTPVLKQVFVTEKEGAVARQLPSSAAREVTSYSFGEQLEVIEDRENWYGVRDRIYRAYDEDNNGIIETDVIMSYAEETVEINLVN